MRSLTVGEAALLAGTDYGIHQRIRVANGDGTLVDYSGWLERITIDQNIDQPVDQATIEFRRDDGALSLSPLRTDSTLNRLDDGLTYAPALDVNRLIVIQVATVALSASPGAGDWKELFRGYIGSVDAVKPTIKVVAQDQGRRLVKRWIKTVKSYGYDEPLETVIQQVLDDTLGAGVLTLYVPVASGFNIGAPPSGPYNQQSESLMSALRTLAQDRAWDIRYLWDDATSSFRLTLYDPPRIKTAPDYTFGPSQYFDASRFEIDDRDVRNYVIVNWRNSAKNYAREDMTHTDPPSIERYGEQFIGITLGDESSLDTPAEVSLFIGNVLSDLKDPVAEFEIEAAFNWACELNDLYRFSPNGVHFNTNQDWAVTSIQQELFGGTGRTYLQVRGRPSGGFLTWVKRERGIQPPERPLFDRILNFGEIGRTPTTITQGWTPETTPLEYWLWRVTKAQPVTSDPRAELVGAPTLRLTPDTTSYTFDIPRTGFITYVRLVAVFEDGRVGPAWDFTIQPNDARPEISLPIQTVAASGLTSDLKFTVSDPAGLGGTLSVWVNKAGSNDADSSAAADGTVAIANTDPPAVVDQNTVFTTGNLLDDIKVHASRGKRVFAEFVNSDGISSGKQTILLQPGKPPTDEDGTLDLGDSLAAALADAEEIITQAAIQQRAVGSLQLALQGVERENVALTAIDAARLDIAELSDITSDPGSIVMDRVNIALTAIDAARLDIAELSDITSDPGSIVMDRVNIALAAIDAARTDIAELSDISTDIGAVVQGRLDNLPASAFINLEATGSQPVIGHPKFALLANGDATFSGALVAASGTFAGSLSAATGTFGGSLSAATGTFAGSLSAVGGTFTGQLVAATGTFTGSLTAATGTFAGSLSAVGGTFTGQLVAATGTFTGSLTATVVFATGIVTNNAVAVGTLTANRLAISELSEIADDAGILVSGELRNAAGTRYINLDATGSQPFIAHEKFEIRADGTAIFTGQLIAATGTFTGSLSSVDGTFTGTLTADVVFTNGIVTNSALAGNITADKLNVTTLESITATTGELTVILGTGAVNFRNLINSTNVGTIRTITDTGVGDTKTGVGITARNQTGDLSAILSFVWSDAGGVSELTVPGDFLPQGRMGFYGTVAQTKQTVTGSRGGNAALASLLTALATYGLITDSTTA